MRKSNLAMALAPVLPVVYLAIARTPDITNTKQHLLVTFVLSVGCFVMTALLVPVFAPFTQRRGLCGKDINKKGMGDAGEVPIPESLGLVCAVVHLVELVIFELYYLLLKTHRNALVEYNAALHSICFMALLGFADDVLDLPWRYKMALPTVASLPLLVAYAGVTTVVIPSPLHPFFGPYVDLGIFYYVYMNLLAIFTSNSINIHAGINGLEAGQSLVIGCAVLAHNLLQLSDPASYEVHLLSVFIIMPFIAVTLALLKFNWYPSRVFVGDTYCYYAGVTFAVVGILGHFSKTLMLFFIPQLINFTYSLPQLLKIYPCPRHRLAKLDPKTGLLHGVKEHMNLLNLTLRVTGPLSERNLCIVLMGLQCLCCLMGFYVRYIMSASVYP